MQYSAESQQIREATLDAVLASMVIVREAQLGGRSIERLTDKDDKSVLTATDKASEAAAKLLLSERFPDIPVLGEETGLSSASQSRYLFMHDPIDGTRPFLAGAGTSTVISGVYDNEQRQVIAATIGEPSTGRIWTTQNGATTRILGTPDGVLIDKDRPHFAKVWDGELGDNGTIFIDNFRGFARTSPDGTKRQILTDQNIGRLFLGLSSRVAIQNYGSNGYHHALVANGGQTVAGSITTSMGGEWDVPGALAVLNAGGAAEGLRMTDDRKIQSADPLDPFSYDMLVTANNDDSLRELRQAVVNSLN